MRGTTRLKRRTRSSSSPVTARKVKPARLTVASPKYRSGAHSCYASAAVPVPLIMRPRRTDPLEGERVGRRGCSRSRGQTASCPSRLRSVLMWIKVVFAVQCRAGKLTQKAGWKESRAQPSRARHTVCSTLLHSFFLFLASLPHRLKHLCSTHHPLKEGVVGGAVWCSASGRGWLLHLVAPLASGGANPSRGPFADLHKGSWAFSFSSGRSTTLSAPLEGHVLSSVIIRARSVLSPTSSPSTSATASPTHGWPASFPAMRRPRCGACTACKVATVMPVKASGHVQGIATPTLSPAAPSGPLPSGMPSSRYQSEASGGGARLSLSG